MSDCKKIVDLLGAYVYGDLSPEEMRRVRLHVKDCEKCSGELAERSLVVKLIPSELPKLSDEERMRIAWTVKGAVRTKEESKRFFLFTPMFMRGMAFAATIVVAFAAGKIYGTKTTPVRVVTEIKRVPFPVAVPFVEANESSHKDNRKELLANTGGTQMDWYNRERLNVYRGGGWRSVASDPNGLDTSGDVGTGEWPWNDGIIGTNPSGTLLPLDGAENQQGTDVADGSVEPGANKPAEPTPPHAMPKPESSVK